MQTKTSGKRNFYVGIFQFLWAELKTMNVAKIKSIYKIGIGYIRMKYFPPKKRNKQLEVEKEKQKLLRETSYRLSS
jgi:hypothetical protein